jgi:predicted Fe-Mo cluster-binding NifX family protein
MKICISSTGTDLNADVDPRFGRCQYFLIVDTETMTVEIISNESTAVSSGAGIQAAQTVVRSGVNSVITGNIGPNAFQTLQAAGINVITGVNGSVKDIVEKFKKGELKETNTPSVESHFGMGNKKKEKSMKICIPTNGNNGLDEAIGEHFGRVPTYTIVDLDTNEVKVVPNTSEHMGGVGYPPEIMVREGVNVLVCRGLGQRAIGMFAETGIDVYIGASGTVKDAISAFRQGQLKKADIGDACGRHAFRDEHEHHHEHHGEHCK